MVDSIYVNAPDEIKEIYKKILWSLLMKMKVPSENARELMGGIGGRGMGYLFENMEEIDIGAQKRNTAERNSVQRLKDNARMKRSNARMKRSSVRMKRSSARMRKSSEQMRKNS